MVAGEVLVSEEVRHVVVSGAVSSGRSARWVSYAGLAELPGVIEFITNPPWGPELNTTRRAGVAVDNTHTAAYRKTIATVLPSGVPLESARTATSEKPLMCSGRRYR